jgi:type IV pilus assembly protein PilX
MNVANRPASSLVPHRLRPARQRGVVLFTALVLLLILTLVGVLLARSESVEETISENVQDHQVAIQAAEATLRFAEVGLYNGTYAAFAANTGGLYTWQSGMPDAFEQYTQPPPAGTLLTYGVGCGDSCPPALPAVAAVPQFMIESLPAATIPGAALGAVQYGAPTPPVNVYRITAYSYGGDLSATAELQEIDWQ